MFSPAVYQQESLQFEIQILLLARRGDSQTTPKLSLGQIQFHELITAIGINKLGSTMASSSYGSSGALDCKPQLVLFPFPSRCVQWCKAFHLRGLF